MYTSGAGAPIRPSRTVSRTLLTSARLDILLGHIASALHDDVYAVEVPEPNRSYEGADSDVSDFEDEDEDDLPTAESLTLGSEDEHRFEALE
ncbi:hypothetical protein BBJ28_00021752 [Nothophytophthora sp. Chile5]|nr:hypothetical protein BBJ28_00021752 [Nothophytophthora sp. Chile5]